MFLKESNYAPNGVKLHPRSQIMLIISCDLLKGVILDIADEYNLKGVL